MGFPGFLARVTALLLIAAGMLYGVGCLLPRDRRVEKTTVIQGAPDRVFDVLADVEGQRVWRSDLSNVAVDADGNPKSWTAIESGYSLRFTEVSKLRPERYELAFESTRGFGGRRTVQLAPTPGGRTSLTCTLTIEIPNPFLRVASHALVNLDTIVDRYLSDLGVRVAAQEPLPATKPAATGARPAPTEVLAPPVSSTAR